MEIILCGHLGIWADWSFISAHTSMIVMAQKEKLEALYSAIKYFVMEALYIIFIPYSFTRIHCVHCVQAQSCQTLCDLINCNLPGPSVHGIFQVRILASVAMSSSRAYSPPRDWTCVSCVSFIESGFFICWATGKASPQLITPNFKKEGDASLVA